MKVCIIGGTGLLGSEAASELIRRGHSVVALALPPAMELVLDNYMTMTDDALLAHLKGCDGLAFAAGVDERVEGPPPIYDLFERFNITPLRRLLRLTKEAGVKHVVICGSYFVYFDRLWPEKRLAHWHPYIRSRVDQETMALSFAGDGFDVAVLELPYIFGAQPGRKPVWVFLVEMLRGMKKRTYYPRGGTAMVTVKQVGQAMAGALERNKGANAYPIGYYNVTWRDMLQTVHEAMGMPGRRTVTVPDWMFTLGTRKIDRQRKAAGHEGGLRLSKLYAIQCAELFIDKSLGCEPLGVQPDDIRAAITQSILLCVDVLDGKTDTLGMRGE